MKKIIFKPTKRFKVENTTIHMYLTGKSNRMRNTAINKLNDTLQKEREDTTLLVAK
jgi:hypothetical protein